MSKYRKRLRGFSFVYSSTKIVRIERLFLEIKRNTQIILVNFVCEVGTLSESKPQAFMLMVIKNDVLYEIDIMIKPFKYSSLMFKSILLFVIE